MPQILYGLNTAEEILNGGRRRVMKLYIVKGGKNGRFDRIIDAARRQNVSVEFCEQKKIEKMAGPVNHQGVVIEAEPPRKMSLDEALGQIADGKKTVWAALDGITDPMNLGAIIRSAACLGVTTVLLPERRSASMTASAQKTASGAAERINIVEVGNLNQAVLKLKKKGFWIYGLAMGGVPIHEMDFVFPALLLIGSEGDGLHQKTREHCDGLVGIVQKGGVESLNAGNAAAIAFYELSKKI